MVRTQPLRNYLMNCKLLKDTQLNDPTPIFCEWCNSPTECARNYFSSHLRKVHKQTPKMYYDEFCKTEDEGRCFICGNDTRYNKFKYNKFCCSACLIEFNKHHRIFPENYSEHLKLGMSKIDYAKANAKRKETNIEKYGVEHISQIEGHKEKVNATCLERYGELIDFSNKRQHNKALDTIKNNYDDVNEKRRMFWNSGDNIKIALDIRRDTCLERYGVDSVSKLEDTYDKIRKTREAGGDWLPIHLQKPYTLYRLKIKALTLKQKEKLFENWDGLCYYTGEKLLTQDVIKTIPNFIWYEHSNYPTIDHKISCYHGYTNNIPVEEIAAYDNLCICKWSINCSKNYRTEEEFREIYKNEIL